MIFIRHDRIELASACPKTHGFQAFAVNLAPLCSRWRESMQLRFSQALADLWMALRSVVNDTKEA